MASTGKKALIFLLLALLSSFQIHARESHFFNKVTSNNGVKDQTTVAPQEQEPNFTIENENGHGLYGHESGQLPPSATTVNGQQPHTTTTNAVGIPSKKHLPKNYNPVAYVTVAEDNTDEEPAAAGKESNIPEDTSFMSKEFTTTAGVGSNQYYTGSKESNMPEDTSFMSKEFTAAGVGNNQYLTGSKESNMPADGTIFDDKEFTPATAADNYHYYFSSKESNMPEKKFSTASAGGGNTYYFNNQESSMPEDKFTESENYQQEQTYPTATTGETHFNNNGGSANWVQPQGMSDTRFLENGKYYYDVNAEKYARNPYENSRDFAAKSRNQFNNNKFMENSNQNVEEFGVEEEGMP